MEMNKVTISDTADQISVYGDTLNFVANRLSIYGNNGLAPNGAGITCLNCNKFHVWNSNFRDLKAEQGGAIYLEQGSNSKVKNPQEETYSIIGSTFMNNFAKTNGGAVFLGSP